MLVFAPQTFAHVHQWSRRNWQVLPNRSNQIASGSHLKKKTDGLTCAVAAPTGLAAFNVGGVTCHRLLQLSIQHEGKQLGIGNRPNNPRRSCALSFAMLSSSLWMKSRCCLISTWHSYTCIWKRCLKAMNSLALCMLCLLKIFSSLPPVSGASVLRRSSV